MLIKIQDNAETLVVESAEILIEMVRVGKINKNSRVYDGEEGLYRTLEEVEAVKDMAMDVNYNKYLCMNTKKIISENRKENSNKRLYKTIILVSLTMLVLGIILRVIGYIKLTSSIDANSGFLLGAQLGQVFFFILIWFGIMRWYSNKRKNVAGITLVAISFLYLLVGYITFQISGIL